MRSCPHQMPCDAELPPPDALRCGAAPDPPVTPTLAPAHSQLGLSLVNRAPPAACAAACACLLCLCAPLSHPKRVSPPLTIASSPRSVHPPSPPLPSARPDGITNFDSLPWAMVSLFQAISLEGWVDMMYQLMDGVNAWVVIYFILLVTFGAIIVMNLFLGDHPNSRPWRRRPQPPPLRAALLSLTMSTSSPDARGMQPCCAITSRWQTPSPRMTMWAPKPPRSR